MDRTEVTRQISRKRADVLHGAVCH
jgi:hypothetical protein